ncbi:MAG TPA: helix-turn-helix transcriptional regulator [Candidatus Sulfotelmatobacter sp.]|jgi:ribosome-binding protein aMBF1 (putative translation factor)|nr:helix-turn-helix transcriptional regulator [Candidatus Sulfotelmatobacter sp.]
MNFQTHKKQLMKNPTFRKAYEESELEYQIARALVKARTERGYTQEELAEKLHTKQSVISRVENAKTVPSMSFLKRLAEVLDASLQVEFKF